MEAVLIALLIAQADPQHVMCTSGKGPIPLGPERITVPLQCCPEGKYIFDENRPFDKHGKLVCVLEERT